MDIKNYKPDDSIFVEKKSLKLRFKKLPLTVHDTIDCLIKPPACPTGFKIDKDGNSNLVDMPTNEWRDECMAIGRYKIAALVYFSVDDDSISFETDHRDLDNIDIAWCKSVYEELSSRFSLGDYDVITSAILEEHSFSDQEIEKAAQHFLEIAESDDYLKNWTPEQVTQFIKSTISYIEHVSDLVCIPVRPKK